jgi:Cu-Zn family superoxide dismutase
MKGRLVVEWNWRFLMKHREEVSMKPAGLQKRSLLVMPVAIMLILLGGISAASTAQDSTPAASPADAPLSDEAVSVALVDVDGSIVGTGTVATSGDQVLIRISGSGLEPGEHGIHIHEIGRCDAAGDEPFASAGDHYNPSGASHGGPQDDEAHAGDLGNVLVDNAGSYRFSIATDRVSLNSNAGATLRDANGSALLIHAAADDLQTDPTGNSGGRVACGVIVPSTLDGTPVASPAATPAS